MTRQVLITWLWRMAGSPAGAPPAGYVDQSSIAVASRPAANWGRFRGITVEFGNNRFAPGTVPTRQNAIIWVWRLARTRAAWGTPRDGTPDTAIFDCCVA